MMEDFFLPFFGHNLHFFWFYQQIKSALNFKSYNFITCMESHWSAGSFATFWVVQWGILSSKSFGQFSNWWSSFHLIIYVSRTIWILNQGFGPAFIGWTLGLGEGGNSLNDLFRCSNVSGPRFLRKVFRGRLQSEAVASYN